MSDITEQPSTPPAQDSNDKLIIILCHLSIFLGVGLILPLIIFLVKKDNQLVADHAKEALNFHINLTIYAIVSGFLACIFIGYFLLLALVVAGAILAVLAAIKASEGGFYKYPYIFRLVK